MTEGNSQDKPFRKPPTSEELTQYLHRAYEGDDQAYELAFPLIYEELRNIAKSIRFNFLGIDTLNTTAIVHEAYLKLSGSKADWNSRAHYYSVAAKAMRQVLLNAARDKKAIKRGEGVKAEPIEEVNEVLVLSDTTSEKLINLNELLVELEKKDEVYGRIVECRFFAGLSIKETAEALNLSPATVKRKWQMARDWLFVRLPKHRSA